MAPILLEVLWNRITAVVNEQAAALMRTSFTSVLREAGDLSAGVFDRRGRMIAQAVTGTPGHINSMATGVAHFLEAFPLASLDPGDVLVTNDPWKTASQLNDITVVTPVFRGERLVAFFANTCHAVDIGGRGLSADAHEVFEEGVCLPMARLFRSGEPNETVFEILRANVRAPKEVLGDLHAQVVANEVGGRELLEFLDEFRLPDIEELADLVVESSEAAMRASLAEIEDGEYPYELGCDGLGEPLRIRVTVSIRGDSMVVDYSGTSEQVDRGINVAFNYTHAYTTYGIKCVVSPEIPNNEGAFRPVTVRAPEGCILNARRPAAVGGRHLVGHFLPSALFGALAEAVPDRVMAAGADALWDTQIVGHDPERGRPFTYVWFSAGGAGARPQSDGLSATAFPSGIAGVPAEVIESLSPLVVRRRELRPDSGGPGRCRGGLGQTLEIAVRTDRPFLFSGLYDRIHVAAPGLGGGRPGARGGVRTAAGDRLEPKARQRLAADTIVTLEMPGGAGYGPPWERDRGRVLADVQQGYVSLESARDDYGVVLDEGCARVLEPETERLRDRLRRLAAGRRT